MGCSKPSVTAGQRSASLVCVLLSVEPGSLADTVFVLFDGLSVLDTGLGN